MQVVYWHPIKRQSFMYPDREEEFPVLGTGESGWVLLQQVQQMPPGNPISFADATKLAFKEIHRQMRLDNMLADDPSSSTWILTHTVEWVSRQGYRIELTGDEFEVMEAETGNLDAA